MSLGPAEYKDGDKMQNLALEIFEAGMAAGVKMAMASLRSLYGWGAESRIARKWYEEHKEEIRERMPKDTEGGDSGKGWTFL